MHCGTLAPSGLKYYANSPSARWGHRQQSAARECIAGKGGSMQKAIQALAQVPPGSDGMQNESVLNILKLISAGSPLPEVLAVIARLVESQGEGLFCTIWLPDEEASYLHCVAAPSLPGFCDHVGRTEVCPMGASCGTAVYRREPVYVT